VKGVRPRGMPKKTWSEVTEKNYQTRQDAMKMEKVDSTRCIIATKTGCK